VGFPYQVLAYEHSYDAVLAISHKLKAWAHAMGIPAAKLIHAPNAPSYPVEDTEIERIMADRRTRSGPLRLAYIGRFDRQKGLDRLVGLVKALAQRGAAVEWRIVGAPVVVEAESNADLALLEPFRHPPTRNADELTDHLAWADVLVMPSYFEGVPLMVGAMLELIQRFAGDRAQLRLLAEGACAAARAHDWSNAARALAARLPAPTPVAQPAAAD
jgi:glycosyltransferase involved in cell wall biosynthesis